MLDCAPAVASKTHSGRLPLSCAYMIEGLTAISASLLMTGVAFYTTQKFHFSTGQNLLLMMAQGIAYAAGALSAGPVTRRVSKPATLIAVNCLIVVLTTAISLGASTAVLIPLLLVNVFVSTFTWPLVESLVTEGCDAVHMNRRITVYNMIWSGMNVLVIAGYGTILQLWPAGPLVIPVICHGIGVCIAIILALTHRTPAFVDSISHGDPEVAAQLASSRKMAMWLSRISLPASFVVANSLMGIFPTLRISAEIGVAGATLVASIWMAGRFGIFILLGMTSFWHTRPRLLLGGGVLMLLSFLLTVLAAERLGMFQTMSTSVVVMIIIFAELLFGIVAGFVFSASLYFGMVLSGGSTDHGGYHEALIGVGMVVGPGLAAGAQHFSGTNTNWPAICSVAGLSIITLAFAAIAAIRLRPRD